MEGWATATEGLLQGRVTDATLNSVRERISFRGRTVGRKGSRRQDQGRTRRTQRVANIPQKRDRVDQLCSAGVSINSAIASSVSSIRSNTSGAWPTAVTGSATACSLPSNSLRPGSGFATSSPEPGGLALAAWQPSACASNGYMNSTVGR